MNENNYIFAITPNGYFFYSFDSLKGVLEPGIKISTIKYPNGYSWISGVAFIDLEYSLLTEDVRCL